VHCPDGTPRRRNRDGDEDSLVLLMLEREDLVPLAYLNKFAVVTGIDTSTWRNRASLRVRFSESRNA